MTHLGGALETGDQQTYTPDIWGWLLLEFDIRTVIDIGCGYGWNAEWFKRMGCKVHGIEGHPHAIANNRLEPHEIIVHDYTVGPHFTGARDLALLMEFVEHVEAKFEHHWLATVQPCQWVLMSHAVPGQDGYHHVNCQDSEYWISRLEMRGFEYYPEISSRFRQTCSRVPADWGRNTLLFFGKST